MTNEVIAYTTSNVFCEALIWLIIIADKLFWLVVILTFLIQAKETSIPTIPPEKGLYLITPEDDSISDDDEEDYEYESDVDDEEEDYEYESDVDDDEEEGEEDERDKYVDFRMLTRLSMY